MDRELYNKYRCKCYNLDIMPGQCWESFEYEWNCSSAIRSSIRKLFEVMDAMGVSIDKRVLKWSIWTNSYVREFSFETTFEFDRESYAVRKSGEDSQEAPRD